MLQIRKKKEAGVRRRRCGVRSSLEVISRTSSNFLYTFYAAGDLATPSELRERAFFSLDTLKNPIWDSNMVPKSQIELLKNLKNHQKMILYFLLFFSSMIFKLHVNPPKAFKTIKIVSIHSFFRLGEASAERTNMSKIIKKMKIAFSLCQCNLAVPPLTSPSLKKWVDKDHFVGFERFWWIHLKFEHHRTKK